MALLEVEAGTVREAWGVTFPFSVEAFLKMNTVSLALTTNRTSFRSMARSEM